MNAKQKSMWIGVGALIGIGIGLLTFKNLHLINIGNVDKLTLIAHNQGVYDSE